MPKTRFAPSPTGLLHLGHAYSALFAASKASPGSFIVRIEDIDPARSKASFTHAILEDLRWLTLTWQTPVRIQSEHTTDYAQACKSLREAGLLYPCFCTRKEIEDEARRSATAPHQSELGFVYPRTCKALSPHERQERLADGKGANWRLDIETAKRITGPLLWHDHTRGTVEAHPERFGDVVIARKDIETSYHLSVTVDDHIQGIDLVTRGADLLPATDIHVTLQHLLGYQVPAYWHHNLITDPQGQRYAKRDQSKTISALRAEGFSPEQLRNLLPSG